jgi:hypothetical protein
MVRLHFETLAPGMKAKLDSPRRLKNGVRPSNVRGKRVHGSVNCLLADAVKMPYNRFKA